VTNLPYSLIVESTDDPHFFGFYSPELEGFSGTGSSVEDCLTKARLGMKEHVRLLEQSGRPVPAISSHPTVIIRKSESVVPAA